MQKRLFLTLGLMLGLYTLYAKEKSHGTHSPSLKIGYVNVDQILGFLPEAKAVDSELTSFARQLEKQLEEKTKEYHQKEQAFRKGHASMEEAVKNRKELELQQLQGNIRRLQLEAQEKFVSKNASLLAPIYEKVKNAIAQVAKENGYTHVLNADVEGMSVLLYANAEHNLFDLILQKLGVAPNKTKDTKK